jgi:hypothetical protein
MPMYIHACIATYVGKLPTDLIAMFYNYLQLLHR